MATQNIRTRSGNRIQVMLDGALVGLIRSIRMNDDYSPEPASGIGDIHVQEYVPTMARHNVTVQQMVLIRGAIRQLQNVAIENGDKALEGMVFDILIVSKDDGSTLRKYIGCSYASGDIEVSAHQITSASATFNCLDVTGTVI